MNDRHRGKKTGDISGCLVFVLVVMALILMAIYTIALYPELLK